MPNKYEEIIHLAAPKSKRHPSMSLNDRAKIFLPFAALKGYDEMIDQKNEIFEDKIELAEDKKVEIEEKLNYLNQCEDKRSIMLTYFVANKQGKGGHYLTIGATLEKIDPLNRSIFIQNSWIDFDDILDISM